MLHIITALPDEAEPLVRTLQLRRRTGLLPFRLYLDDTISISVSGVGVERSAMAVAALLARAPQIGGDPEHDRLLNIGLCGSATPERFPIGAGARISLVHDIKNKRDYPLAVESSAKNRPLATLSTCIQPVTAKNVPPNCELVDMEAAGFCRAALTRLRPEQIACFKIVSDLLIPEQLTRDRCRTLIENRLPELLNFIRRQRERSDCVDPAGGSGSD